MKLPAFRSPGPTLWGIGVFLIILAVSAPWIPVFLLTLFIGLLISATLAYSLTVIIGHTLCVVFSLLEDAVNVECVRHTVLMAACWCRRRAAVYSALRVGQGQRTVG